MQQGNTKERIVEAYIELEAERPVEKITVTALVERSRITRKTFYYYFKDIYDLMEYRMEREMKRVMEETMSQPDPEKALAQLYMYIMENQKHIRALSESAQFMALRRQMGEKVYQYFYNHLERIGMQIFCHGRQGRVQNRAIEHLHEKGDRDDPRQDFCCLRIKSRIVCHGSPFEEVSVFPESGHFLHGT